jgi:signal transduction histidine kinase
MLLLVAVSTLCLSSLSFVLLDNSIFNRSIKHKLELTSNVVSRGLIPAITFLDQKEASRIISSLEEDPSFVASRVYDLNGNIFASHGNLDEPPEFLYKCQKLVKSNQSTFTFKTRKYIFHCHVLKQLSDPIGQLVIKSDLSSITSEFQNYPLIAFSVFLLGMCLSLILAQILHRSLSIPIQSLARTVQQISESNNYKLRVSIDGTTKDTLEYLSLINQFNRMLSHIETRDMQINQEKTIAETANQAKSVFLANISHELRTPMHGILSFARFGLRDASSATREDLSSYFNEIMGSASKLMELLNDLLDLSKLESGRMEYNKYTCDLFSLCQGVNSEFTASMQERHLTCSLQKDSSSTHAVIDPNRITQVLRNLVSNAIKFASENTEIVLSIYSLSDQLHVSVTNVGVDIPERELESIFDKFVQSSKTRTNAGGTGLGLAICREIIGQHGGKIWAQSGADGITRFIFSLPHGSITNEQDGS